MPTLDLETGPTLLHPAPPHKINKVWDERYQSPYLNKLRVVSLIAPPPSSQDSVGLEDYASFFWFADLGFNPTGLSIKGVQISLPIMKASNSLLKLLLLLLVEQPKSQHIKHLISNTHRDLKRPLLQSWFVHRVSTQKKQLIVLYP